MLVLKKYVYCPRKSRPAPGTRWLLGIAFLACLLLAIVYLYLTLHKISG